MSAKPPQTDVPLTYRGRLDGPEIVSHAQNAEDVRLWRVFGGQHRGFYVDVGAGDPVQDSVTKLFYDAGWDGLNIEPGPLWAELVTARPRDVTLEIAVASEEGEADFWVSTPDSGFSGFDRLPQELLPEGYSYTHKRVRRARLDTLIAEHAAGRAIDFLKIDAEGAEREVLMSFDPTTIRPKVVVVEAISPLENVPNHEAWEALLLDGGYVDAAFDGINRFYVPAEHRDLVDTLAYPVSVLDNYVPARVAAERSYSLHELQRLEHEQQARIELERELHERELSELRRDLSGLREDLTGLRADLATLREERSKLEHDRLRLERQRDQLATALNEVEATISWRVTRPLRAIRAMQLRHARPAPKPGSTIPPFEVPLSTYRGSEHDDVYVVTGVPATEILRRCAAIRNGGPSRAPALRSTWNMADLASVSEADFVRAAHVALLGRVPDDAATSRRLTELRSGRRRLTLLMRLAWSPEGRRFRDPRVSGPQLRTLVAVGRGIEMLAQLPGVGRAVRTVEDRVRYEASSDAAGDP